MVTININAETRQALINRAVNLNEESPVVTLNLRGVDGVRAVVLDTDMARHFADEQVSLVLMLQNGEITLPSASLATLSAIGYDAGEVLPITITTEIVPMSDLRSAQVAQINGYETVFRIEVFVGNDRVNVPLTISLPFAFRSPMEDPNNVRVWHMNTNGTLTVMNGVFDVVTGMITFTFNHQGYFFVRYAPLPMSTITFVVGSRIFIVDEELRTAHTPPFVDPATNQVMVSLGNVSEAMGAVVDWNEATRQVFVFHNGRFITSLTIGEPLPSGIGVPVVIGNCTFVPLHFIMYLFGGNAEWSSADGVALINLER